MRIRSIAAILAATALAVGCGGTLPSAPPGSQDAGSDTGAGGNDGSPATGGSSSGGAAGSSGAGGSDAGGGAAGSSGAGGTGGTSTGGADAGTGGTGGADAGTGGTGGIGGADAGIGGTGGTGGADAGIGGADAGTGGVDAGTGGTGGVDAGAGGTGGTGGSAGAGGSSTGGTGGTAGSGGAAGACSGNPAQHTLLGITTTPPAANVTGNSSEQLAASAYYADAPTTAVDVTNQVTWSSSDPTIVSVTSGGLASWSGATGTAKVTATLSAATANTNFRVWDATRLGQLTSLSISGIPAFVSSGECHQAQVIATFTSATDTEDVTSTALWSAGGRARVLGSGLFAADGTAIEGYYNVTASLVSGGTSATQQVGIFGPLFAATCSDPRVPGPLWGISIAPGSSSQFLGEAKAFEATGIYADGSERPISNNITWQSCDGALLDVTADGLAIGRGVGSTFIAGTLDGVVASAPVDIGQAPALGTLDALGLDPPAANIAVGGNYRLVALGSYSGAAGKLVDVSSQASWSTGDSAVATVSGGSGSGGTTGLTAIGATLGGQSASANVRVWTASRLAAITSIAIQEPSNSITGGQCEQLQLIATFNNNPSDTEDVYNSGIWSPASSSYGTLSSTGFFTSVAANGYITIEASLGHGLVAPTATEIGVFGSGGTCP